MAQAGYGVDKQQFLEKTFRALFGEHATQYRKSYVGLRALQESASKCLLPYQRHLFVQFENLLKLADELPEDIPYPAMCERLRTWSQYLLKFKELSDSANAMTLTMSELNLFLQWCHSQKGKRILVLDRLDMYFPALTDCLKNGKEWIHFNINWEDDHIKRVDEYLV
jgi:hypothetical protein